MKLLGKILMVLAWFVLLLIVAAGLYDRFFSPWGGVFCLTHEGKEKLVMEGPVCEPANRSLPSSSLVHSGDRNMVLLKFGETVFRSCLWVDERTYTYERVYLDPDMSYEEGILRSDFQFVCHAPSKTTINRKVEGSE